MTEKEGSGSGEKDAEGGGAPPLPYPRGAFIVLVGYPLERVVYSGLLSGAVLYMQRMLGFTAVSAKTTLTTIEGFVYAATIAGAILADTYLGRARTVFLMCCGILMGTSVYTLSAATPLMASVTAAKVTGMAGLLTFGLCSGLMKAVYYSLGADQFKMPEQKQQQSRFFYAFYWMICGGAFLGQVISAQLRSSVQCFGDDCYLLPYVIMVGIMVTSTAVFAVGRSRLKEAPPDNMLVRCMKCIVHALRKSWDKDRKQVPHWLDRAQDSFDADLISNVKTTLSVLCLFCTFPPFWALLAHTGTSMIFQAKRLDGLIGSYRIPPELSSIGTVLSLIFIPLFDMVVYPLLGRIGVLTKVPSRMILGMALTVCSFVVYGLVNISVEQVILSGSQARVHCYNALPCPSTVAFPGLVEGRVEVAPGMRLVQDVETGDADIVGVVLEASCYTRGDQVQVQLPVTGAHESTLVFAPSGPLPLPPTLEYIKDEDAEAKVRVISPDGSVNNLTLKFDDLLEHFNLSEGGSRWSPFKRISPKDYMVVPPEGDPNTKDSGIGEAIIRQDGVYDVVVNEDGQELYVFAMTPPAAVHMLWVLPQHILLAIGDLLFFVSGLEFAYSQAPTAMKSTLQAANLFTISIGLWLFAGLTSITSATGSFKHRPSQEAFFYAALMALNTIAFVLLLRWYNARQDSSSTSPTSPTEPSPAGPPSSTSAGAEKTEEKKGGPLSNPAFVDDHVV